MSGLSLLQEDLMDLVSSDRVFSDIRIESGSLLSIKTPIGWTAVGDTPVDRDEIKSFMRNVDPEWETLSASRAIDRPYTLSNCRLRCNIFHSGGGRNLSMIIRRLPLRPRAFEDIGLPKYMGSLLEARRGLILVTGATGSGKTTTLSSIIDYYNRLRQYHIVTIEAPIEYVHENNKSVITQKEVPTDVDTFAHGLEDALRQKPEVIMVGEIRDADTAETCFHAAESGHLVLASMHTNSSIGAINRLLDFFPGQHQQRLATLANSLRGIICQSLLPTADGASYVLAAELLLNHQQQISLPLLDAASDISKLRNLDTFLSRRDDNMSISLNVVLAEMVRRKQITQAAAEEASYNRQALQNALRSASAPVPAGATATPRPI